MAWSPEQLSNAKVIINVGRQLGASDRDITIALMAGWQESGLRNLNYGDRDSIGIFQQRGGWGSKADRLDPVKSARMFFQGGAQGQRGLLDFKGRDSWDLGQAAQKVQVSAFPDAYDKWQDESEQLLKELGGSSSVVIPANPGKPTDSTDPTKPSADPTGQPSAALSALGLGSPTSSGVEAAGTASAGAPGIESADESPEFNFDDLPQMDEMQFLPSSTGEPGGVAGSLEDLFPKNPSTNGGARQRVVDIAKTGLGVMYAWGGNSLREGVDCSGLVQQAFKQMGISLPRISAAQARAGKRVGLDKLQVGDLVAWDNSSRNNGADHIAIYIGNGQIIEAPRTGLSVRIRSLGASDRREAWGVDMSQYF